jgi:D-alanyl-D-alanine carboxypeptidase
MVRQPVQVRRRRSRVSSIFLVSIALAVVALAVPTGLAAKVVRVVTGTPTEVDMEGPLPACRADDIPAIRRGPAEWAHTLLDPMFTLEPDDNPTDLVETAEAGIAGGGSVRLLVIDDLRTMTAAARGDGVRLRVRSAFRSYDAQIQTVESLEHAYGQDWTDRSAARPGHSEHQLGTALDLDGGDAWLARHAWEHGFVVSYPPERSPRFTCYKPEPWHVRYVGRTEARAVHDSGLSLREWLWAHAGDQR